ncbi:MAG: hypothetical protein ACE5L7_06580 [Candidatus Aminicenantales bacterium]
MNPYGLAVDIIVVVIFGFAFLNAWGKGRVILTSILAALFLLPYIYTSPFMIWFYYGAKVVFGMSCYLYVKSKRAL